MSLLQTFFLRPWSHNQEFFDTLQGFILDPSPLCLAVAYLSNKEVLNLLADRINKKYPTRILINLHDLARVDFDTSTSDEDSKIHTITLSPALCDFAKKVGDWWRVYIKRLWSITEDWKQQVMHHKFIISQNRGILIGSPNLSNLSFTNNYENILHSNDDKLMMNYLEEFNEMRALSSDILLDRKLIRMFACPVCGEVSWIDLDSLWTSCCMCWANIKYS
jgi:phosphatidylserine/phosphatidylglycerophosphate/cardiolipin synthase-like enzyme